MKFLTEVEKSNANTYTTLVVTPTSESHAVELSTLAILGYLTGLSKTERLGVLSNLRLTYCHLCGGHRSIGAHTGDCQCIQAMRQIPGLWPSDICEKPKP